VSLHLHGQPDMGPCGARCLSLPYRQLAGFARGLSRILGAGLTIDPSPRVRKNAPNQGEELPRESRGRKTGEEIRPRGVEADGGLRQEVGSRDRHRVLQGDVRRVCDGPNPGGSPAGGRPKGRGVQPALLNRPRNPGAGQRKKPKQKKEETIMQQSTTLFPG